MNQTEDFKKIFEEDVIMVAFGGALDKAVKKNRIRKISANDASYYQEERIEGNKAFHKNLKTHELCDYVILLANNEFKNTVVYTDKADYYIRKSKKGKISLLRKAPTKNNHDNEQHNIKKNYMIPEGKPVDFLIHLGIMDENGKVFSKQYSKFRQINRFLDLVDDRFEAVSGKETVKIVDMGCGKGYLTFALHHYFYFLKGKKVEITGIDLKDDVLAQLNDTVSELSLEGIKFLTGDIMDAELNEPDIVVALHACDTATDIAISKAVKAGTKLIFAVPCCQHEIFKMLGNGDMEPILKYGIMKDKFTELSTNALRGLALEAMGYSVDMIEFTSLEHTMKNIMIRALRTGKIDKGKKEEFRNFSKLLGVESSAARIMD